jgi:hypothetical protein
VAAPDLVREALSPGRIRPSARGSRAPSRR